MSHTNLPGAMWFPGEFAGASLKHEEVKDLPFLAHGFPGEFAGASLKLEIHLS